MSMREWLLAAGIVLIVGVIVHMLWDIWRRRREAGAQYLEIEDVDDLDLLRSELPNGGARVVGDDAPEELPRPRTAASGNAAPGVTAAPGVVAGEPSPPPVKVSGRKPEQQRLLNEDGRPPVLTASAGDEGSLRARAEDRISAAGHRTVPRQRGAGSGGGSGPGDDLLVVVLHVVSREPDRGFTGVDIQALTDACGLGFGDMDIYHRYRTLPGSRIQYSLANGVEPGTFDLAAMEGFASPVLVFFMQLPGPDSPMEAFESMLTAARHFADRLGGDLCDEKMSICTKQTIEHTRQQIIEFQRKQLSRRS